MLKPLPREILEIDVELPDPLRQVYITLYRLSEPYSFKVSEATGKARAYVSMRLNQIETMGLVKSLKEGRFKLFYVEQEKGKI